MTEREIWLKFGPDALHAAAAATRDVQPSPRRVAMLMERFGRDWHDVDYVLRALNMGADPLGLWDRLCVEVILAARRDLSRIRRWIRL